MSSSMVVAALLLVAAQGANLRTLAPAPVLFDNETIQTCHALNAEYYGTDRLCLSCAEAFGCDYCGSTGSCMAAATQSGNESVTSTAACPKVINVGADCPNFAAMQAEDLAKIRKPASTTTTAAPQQQQQQSQGGESGGAGSTSAGVTGAAAAPVVAQVTKQTVASVQKEVAQLQKRLAALQGRAKDAKTTDERTTVAEATMDLLTNLQVRGVITDRIAGIDVCV